MNRKFLYLVILIIIAVLASYVSESFLTRRGAFITITVPTTSTTVYLLSNPMQNATLRIALSTDISTIDIHYATGVADFEVLGNVYESLFRITYNGSKLAYIPWLVKEFKQLNDTAWLFVLRNGIMFQNGERLTAYDVKASLERSMRLSGIGKQLLTDAKGRPIISDIVIINDTAFIIMLREPFTPLIEHLAHLSTAIMPRDVALKYWNGPINSTQDVIGTGPFMLESYEKGSRAVLKRFDGYWGRKPAIQNLVYLILPDANARISAILSGSVDIATGVSPDMVNTLRAQGIEVYRVTGVRLVLVAINCLRIPDVRVRQALNYAINRSAIVKELMDGYAQVAMGIASPVFPGAAVLEPYNYNVSKARELIEEAGFAGKKLTLLVSTRSPKDVQLAQVVQQYLKAVGVDVEIVQMEHTAFLKRVFIDHDFDLAIYGPSPSSLYYALTYWRTNASLNGPQYSNPEVDMLLDRIAREVNESKRLELYRDVQEVIWRDAPAMWLYFEDVVVAARPSVKGLQILPFQKLVLDSVYIG
jgi:peptide/nickel transport system substrate-binding protein